MADLKPTADPYRVLGVLRGASLGQIKAAHRRLAKRYHPDGSTGDESRFLAVQDAYQLLSDPRRRTEWDRRHASGPVRATGSGRSSARGGAGRRPGADAKASQQRRATGATRPGRQPDRRRRTWSAEHVPWWQDFSPGSPTGTAAERSEGSAEGRDADKHAADGVGQQMDFDVFNRSSGAAWSSAARQHFRRDTDKLPSRGAWRYRGTQVVTGAEARKVAAEEEGGDSRS